MIHILLASVVIALYLLAIACQKLAFGTKTNTLTRWVYLFGFLAVLAHGWLLHLLIALPLGQNLSYLNMLSLIFCLVGLLILLSNIRMPVLNLVLFIFPLSILAIIASLLFPSYFIVSTGVQVKPLIHILLSIITASFLCVAALQACFLTLQEKILRAKRANFLRILPPLQTMEDFLFQTIWIGFLLLTAVIISSAFFFHDIFRPELLSKTVLSVAAWIVFTTLLVGRYFAGWRGKLAIKITILGFFILFAAYFGTTLIGN